MKKIVYVFTICSALLLFGCTEEKSSVEKESATQVPVANEKEKGSEENISLSKEQTSSDGQSEPSKTEKVITPEKAEEVVKNIVETAQEDQIVNDIKIDDSKDKVIANIKFNEEVSDKERGSFLFNYMLFLEKQYPEQEVKINIEE